MNPPLSLFPELPAPATPPQQTRGTLQIAVGVVLRLDFPNATMVEAPGPKGEPGVEPSKETTARIDEALGRILAMTRQAVIVATGGAPQTVSVSATLSNPKVLGSYLAPELPLQEAPTVAEPALEPDQWNDCRDSRPQYRVADPLEPQTPAVTS